jgi:DNA repair protein RadC
MIVREYKNKNGPKVRAPEEMAARFGAVITGIEDEIEREKERFMASGLNGANRIIYIDVVSVGTLNASLVHPREVFRRAVQFGCSSIILGHNHPSGEPDPSAEDRAVTMQMVEAGKLMGIPILDHVIVAGERFFSFAKEGLIHATR